MPARRPVRSVSSSLLPQVLPPAAGLLAAAMLLLAALPLRGDVIYLKNGNRIVGQIIRQDSRQVVYEADGGEFAVPRAIVDHLEILPPAERVLPPAAPPPARQVPLPLPAPPPPAAVSAGMPNVIQDQAVDQAQLALLDSEALRHPSEENRYRLVLGYRQAGSFLTRRGQPEAAIELYRHALDFVPNDLQLTLALGYLLVEQTQYRQALDLLRPAAVQYPLSPAIPILMGSAYYYTEDLDRAVAEWKTALALRDDPQVRLALTKAQEEQRVAGSYQQLRSPHFLLRFPSEDGTANHADLKPLGEQVLAALDADFQELERDLDVYPQQTIVVLLYPDQAFKDITRLPSWVGAVNDGKIRIPVSGLTSLTPQLARMLKHELTHSFVHQATQGRCPVWFNEGLAQLEEGATTAGQGVELSRAFEQGRTLPFTALQGPFYKLSVGQANLAYAESLAALEFIRDRYGRGEIRRLLRRMATHPDFGALLEDELRLSYAGLTQAVAASVEQRYGS
jgi:tetratricopeptide (TPR) repeat protein